MLLPGPLKGMFKSRGGQPGNRPTHPANPARTQAAPLGGSAAALLSTRPSRGLEEFFTYIRDRSGLTILDLGAATQQNVTFITDLGHRLCSEDFLQILNDTFGPDGTTDQSNPGRIEYFLKQTLDYQEGQFDGVLVWDVLEYLAPALLTAVMERLQHVVRPKSYMLAFFHAEDKLDALPFYTFRIGAANALEVAQHGVRQPAQLYNNRSLEKLFGRFESVKFFLTRERLREVIIKA
jgi:2-polyprenyl-3-methyl-5-hydroxy-6-metoxy-1,4-benzoquinol methylase